MSSLAGRRLYFVGIGGAGLSAYAQLARAWGAEVRGWDRVDTPYLRNLADVAVDISDEPHPPAGWEVVVSTAYRDRVEGISRAEFLAQLTSGRRTIVVGGAHGKGTTSAMIAFVLDRLGLDPAFAIGAEVPQLGGNARAGEGWFVVEGDESDRTVFGLHADIAVLTNLDLDHHTEFASLAELAAEFEAWLARAPLVVRGDALDPYDVGFSLPGAHNRQNAATALAALEAAGIARAESEQALAEFRGLRRRLELHGEPSGVAVYDDYGHHPAEIAAAISALRERHARVLVLFQPHLYSRTRHLARELGAELAQADVVCVSEVYAAREQPLDGVSGKLVVEAAAELRPGMPVVWTPRVEDAVPVLAGRARRGDAVLTVGAGDVDRAVPLLLEALA